MSDISKTKRQLEIENDELKSIIKRMWFMAKRYAEGRNSYAPSMMNDCTRRALELGVQLEPDPVDGKLLIEVKP